VYPRRSASAPEFGWFTVMRLGTSLASGLTPDIGIDASFVSRRMRVSVKSRSDMAKYTDGRVALVC